MANNITGKRPPALPVDGNGRVVAGIVLPIVDGSGHIIGWSPIATSDQGDGTLAIKVDTDIIIDDPTIILGNVKVGSTDQTAANTRWLKVDSDGTVHFTTSVLPLPTGAATEATLLGIKAQTDFLNFIGTALEVTGNISQSSAITEIARSATSQTLLAINLSRKGATIYNDSGAFLYIKFGTTASSSSFTVRLGSQDYYEVPFGYTGIIDGAWASNGAGDARITELT